MNVQTHLSGQISGQVPDQAGAMYVGLARQNGNSHHLQKQNVTGQRISVTDPARRFMLEKIYEFLMQRQTQSNESNRKNIIDAVRRLEDGLFNTAPTPEEYMNLDTLQSRLHALVQRRSTSMNNPQPSHFVNSSGPFGTMIPTPGMPHHGSSNLIASSSADSSLIASSGCNNMPSSVGSSMNLLQAGDGSSSITHGGSFHLSGGNTISSMGDQRLSSQMIPTPGFNSSNNNSYMNVEAVSSGTGFSSADSLLASQRILHKHPMTGQTSLVMPGFGNHIGNGMRSNMQQRSYASFQAAPVSGGLGSNIQPFTGSGSSESCSTTTATFGESPRPSQRQSEQQPRILMQGDGGGLATTDSSGPGNFSSATTSIGMVMSNQNIDRGRLHPLSSFNFQMNSQTNLQSTQSAAHFRSQSSDQAEKLSLQKSLHSRDHIMQPHQQYHQPSHQFPQQQTFLPHHGLQKQASMQAQGAMINNILQRSSDNSAHVKAEPNIDHLNEVLQPQDSGQFQFSELQTQFRQCSGANQPMLDRLSHYPSLTNEMHSTVPHNNPQQVLLPHQLVAEGQNQYDCLAPRVQSHTSVQGHRLSDQEDRPTLPGSLLHEQKVHQEFCQRLSGHDEAQCNNQPSSEGSISEQTGAFRSAGGTLSSGSAFSRSFNSTRERQFFLQKKWLLILQHARCCKQPEGKCFDCCLAVKKLWKHMDACNASRCIHPHCHDTKKLILHNKKCRSPQCPVCVPVNRRLMEGQKKIRPLRKSNSGIQGSVSGAYESSDATARDINVREALQPSSITETAGADSQPSQKRIKTELPLQAGVHEMGNVFVASNASSELICPLELQSQELRNNGSSSVPVKSELLEVKMDTSRISAPAVVDVKKDSVEALKWGMLGNGQTLNDETSISKVDHVKSEKGGAFQVKQEDVLQASDQGVGTKSGKPKIKGVSMTELFTPEQVRAHIRGLRQWVGQSKAKVEKNQAMERSMSENSCQLCAVEKLTFDPPPIYCTRCNFRIKRNAYYYTVGAGDTCHYICVTCFSGGDTVSIDGSCIPKSRFEKKKNDEETEEWWVQCDKCEAWQHQICALFNGRRNDGGQAEYTCPNCYIEEVEGGERKPLPQSAVLGAKDLPGTILSDHIEQRLFKRLKEERHERALKEGKSYDEVPGAEGLVVRVVSSVDKKLEVKPRFLEIFREENYPSEFPYKSKVVLLFQKIEGVEVCLFGMYVQEFGSECPPPNQRRVYLSYLDSVKYFRPEVRAVNGEALRTFVYHQILIGYLEYCKERGFTSCYIWACPPAKGEDYILYCHPEIQKTPKSDKLREWYLSMLKKASEEKIVVELTNFYDHFFVSTGECKAKITAARLPYFEGDYWPGAAEETIEQLLKEEEGRKQNKKGTTKKMFTKRTLKASGQLDLSSNGSKDLLLMHRLGETISPMKEDFIMVHLQYSCTHCCMLMVSGIRWVCKQCRGFQICNTCFEAEQKLEERERHPVGHKEKHTLHRVEFKGLPEDTKDKDEILESEFFDTRQAFLSLCQGNHYQYDTLRRAKHSSMMVLYHLHNPTAPAFVTTCNICHLDIETGQGWRCETCPDYDVCNSCYQREGGIDHPHKLTNHPSSADRDAQNKEARQLRVLQLRKMLDLLVHASQCRSPHCQYPNCRKVKGLFRHGIQCKTRASGGCVLCKKMWYLLQLHARACKESQCHVPRCRDLKDHLRRLQQQSDSRRRAAVMEMMRQRAAEVAGNSS